MSHWILVLLRGLVPVLVFCGGPLLVLDLHELGAAGFWLMILPTLLLILATEALDMDRDEGLTLAGRIWAILGIIGAFPLLLLQLYGAWYLLTQPPLLNQRLHGFGVILGAPFALYYLFANVRALFLTPSGAAKQPTPPLFPPRYTAQLLVSSSEAYLASTRERQPWGLCGESRIADIFHTQDGGASWEVLHWRRSLLSVFRLGFPTWPPEAVLSLTLDGSKLIVTHRDEWVPFEPGGESLWESTLDGRYWRTRKIRAMDYEGSDHPGAVPSIELDLPETMLANRPNGFQNPNRRPATYGPRK